MAAASSWRLTRWLAGGAVCCAVLALIGCEDGYPTTLAYPSRTDLLVLKSPTDQPVNPDSPGQLDKLIAAINSKKGETLDPKDLSPKDRQDVAKEISKAFGTPAAPKVPDFDDTEASEAIEALGLDSKSLAKGSKLYRRHCLHCHGVAGDGRGPSGPWVNPHPRDYRQGLFKFMSSAGGESRKPRKADLVRTLHSGIDGTSMPSFIVLQEEELDAMASYVIHLSLRGEVEFNTIQTILSKSQIQDDSIEAHVAYWSKNYLLRWKNASGESGLLKPTTTPAYSEEEMKKSVTRGYKLFTDTQGAASCIGCHSDYGRQVNFRYDAWGTLVRPANLTTGIFRGGRRPIDLFWRVKGGIIPSGMPAAASLKDEQAWDVVNFLQALPHPRMLPEDIRARVYVRDEEAKHVAGK